MSFSDRLSNTWARLADLVRRFRISAHADPLRYDVEGYAGETDDVEVFQGVGHAARPAGADAEAIAVAVNARDHHVIVATRDGDTLRAVIDAVGLEADETLVYTSRAVVKLLADGTVEIRSTGGTAKELAYKSDAEALNSRIDALESAFNAHTHPTAPTGPVSTPTPPADTAATVVGTSVVKGE